MVLEMICEVRWSAAKTIFIYLIIALKPYFIGVDVYVHLVRKILVELLIPLQLGGLF